MRFSQSVFTPLLCFTLCLGPLAIETARAQQGDAAVNATMQTRAISIVAGQAPGQAHAQTHAPSQAASVPQPMPAIPPHSITQLPAAPQATPAQLHSVAPVAGGVPTAVIDLTPEQQPLAYLAPTAPAQIDVSAQLDKPNGRYAVGELVNMRVAVDRPSYVTVLNIAPNGAVTVLFPNQFNQNNYASAGVPLGVPGPGANLQVTPPVGREIIKVIATPNPLPLGTLTEFRQVGPFASSAPGTARVVARALKVIEAAPPSALAASGSGVWGETLVALETHEAPPAPVVYTPPPPTGFSIRMSKDAYRVGEPLRFLIGSDRACHLTLLSVSPSGQAGVLFPLSPNAPRRIPGGVWIEVPGVHSPVGLVARRPTGTHIVAALCSTRDIPVVATAETLGLVSYDLTRSSGISQRALQVVYAAPIAPATAQTRASFLVYE